MSPKECSIPAFSQHFSGLSLRTEPVYACDYRPVWAGSEGDKTTTKILGATGAVLSIILIAAGVSLRGAHHDSPQPGVRTDLTQGDFDERWTWARKGDRLPMSLPLAAASAPSEIPQPAASPPQQLQLANDDDLRQAEEEHHRHRDICARGRTWFTMNNHRYWRCNH